MHASPTTHGALRAAAVRAAACFVLCGAAHAQPSKPLAEEIAVADAQLFAAIFDQCDVDALAPLVAEDFEFFHDKWGQIARTKAEFLAAIRGACERQRAGTDFKARRVLEPGSSEVFVMRQLGAFQTGRHRFFRVEPGRPDQATESARFAHLWRQLDGRWQLARVVSYDHVDAPAPTRAP